MTLTDSTAHSEIDDVAVKAEPDNGNVVEDSDKTIVDEQGQLQLAPQNKKDEALDVSLPAEPQYPDGGARAWLVVAGCWAFATCSFGYITGFGIYQAYYEQHQLSDESPSNIAWIGSLQLFFILFSGLFTGRIFDAGYHKPIVYTGSALLIIAVFTTAECTKLWQFILAQGVCGGLGAGLIFQPSVAVPAHWFDKKRALVYGILGTGSSAGGVFYPLMLNKLFIQVGFKWAVRTAGFVLASCLVFGCLATRPRLEPRRQGRMIAIEFHHLRDPGYALITTAAILVIMGMYTPIFYLSTYAVAHGIDPEFAFYLLSILNASSTFGRLLPNIYANKIGPQNILWSASLLSGILCFVWLACKSQASLVVFAILYGATSGSYVATVPAVISNVTPEMNEIGSRMALAMAISSFGALSGTPITGAILSRGGNYIGPGCFAGAIVLVGCGCGFTARHIFARRYKTWVI